MPTLTSAICTARYANCNPTRIDYEAEGPAGRQAIMARWLEIKNSQPQTDTEMLEWCRAASRHDRVYIENNPSPLKTRTPWWHEDYIQGDHDFVDSRQRFELGE